MMNTQRTLAGPVTLNGIGLHSGVDTVLTLHPAPVDTGIVFVRTDIQDRDNKIPARFDRVVDTRLCTVLSNDAGATIGTIEHLMAALRGAEITNAVIEVSNAEVPAMDGSSAVFLNAIDSVGTVDQATPVRMIRVLQEIRVEDGDKCVTLSPADRASFSGAIVYDNPTIGTQEYGVEMLNGNFRHEIAGARTFGLMEEVEAMRNMGLARGGSFDNAIVVASDGVMNPDGLRFEDEFIRHKLLDAIGDLYLAGMPVLGAYRGQKMSHAMNNALLRKLFATPGAYEVVTSPVA